MKPYFSLIIPAYNEAAYLPKVLDSIDKARQRYFGCANDIEVILVDNGSDDNTAQIASDRGCRVVYEKKRVIAASRNCGAQAARGQILAFVDADAQIHAQTFNALNKCMARPDIVGGATGVKPERMSLGIGITLAFLLPFVWISVFDTGLVFCRKQDFDKIGGYNESLFYAEDVQFHYDLMRLGHSKDQRLVRLTCIKSIFSTRKFDQYGDWHYFSLIARFLCSLVFSKRDMKRFAQTYWYKRAD